MPGGLPNDLSEINFSTWAELVQDVAAGLLALPQSLHDCLFPEVTNLLLHFEAVTLVTSCHQCYLPGLTAGAWELPYSQVLHQWHLSLLRP